MTTWVLLLPAYSLYLKGVKCDLHGQLHAVGTFKEREAIRFRFRGDAEKFRLHYLPSRCGIKHYIPVRLF